MSPITIRRARDGNAAAVRALVDALRPRITKMAAFYGRQTGEDADDLQQEAWVGLFDALSEVDCRIGQSEQFLLKRAKWRMLDAVKRRHRHRLGPEPLSSREWADAESEILVRSFTQGLKPIQRDVVRHLIHGLTWREAGNRMGCSSANVAYHVRQIQRLYAQWGEN